MPAEDLKEEEPIS
jgi:hypothetical protein